MTVEADIAIVGSGVSGVLVAREMIAAGLTVAMIERGGRKDHAAQVRDRSYTTADPGSAPNHEVAIGEPDPWDYVYGVGGSSLHWTGVTPRFAATDFRMRSEYGVMQDWPFGLDELEPHYRRAERLLGVAGAPDGAGTMAPHPFSPLDEVLREPLAPYVALPQARPTRTVGRRPACCGSAVCELCPIDSRFSVLNTFGAVLEHPALRLLTRTAVERVEVSGGHAVALRCRGRETEVRARRFVLAAGGIENPGILLRSELAREDGGRYLFDHAHRTLWVRVRRDVGAGSGSSLSTGASNAFRDGPWRRAAGAAYVVAHNPGIPPQETVLEAIMDGRPAREAYRRARARTVVLDVLLDDVPQPERRVTLSRALDGLGLPKLTIAYGPPSPYEEAGFARVRDEVRRRLAPLGVESVQAFPGPAGSHLLGTARIGGVVDPDLRHLDVENLYVTGGSAFPTYSPVHPTLTISALALRLGAHLRRER